MNFGSVRVLAALFVLLTSGLAATAVAPVHADDTPAAPGAFVPMSPTRVHVATVATGNQFQAGETRAINVADATGVAPGNVEAVMVDILVGATSATSNSALYAWTTGTVRPGGPVIGYTSSAEPVSNTALIKPDANGMINLQTVSNGRTSLVVDILGYFTTGDGAGFTAVRKVVLDTRSGGTSTAVRPSRPANVDITDGGLIPDGVTAVYVNVTAFNPTSDGALRIGRADSATANPNFNYNGSGSAIVGMIAPVDSSGQLNVTQILASADDIHVRIEVQGYFEAGSTSAAGAYRLLNQPVLADTTTGTAIPANGSVNVKIGGTNGIPEYGARGVIVTVRVLNFSSPGYLRLYPTGATEPDLSQAIFGDLSETAGPSSSTLVLTGWDGKVTIKNISDAPIDVKLMGQGWFTGERAVSAADEEQFVADAMAVGVAEKVARLAVWDRELADSIPVSVEVSEEPDSTEPFTMTDNPSDLGTTLPPPIPAGASVTPIEDGSGSTQPRTFRDAASQSCASGYILYRDNAIHSYKTRYGRTIWVIGIKKRWCASRTNHRIGSYWSRAIIYENSNFSTWEISELADQNEEYFVKVGGYARGGHISSRRFRAKACAVGFMDNLCHSQYWEAAVNGWWDGGRVGWAYQYGGW